MNKQRRLKNYLIKRRLQLRLTVKFVLLSLLSSLLSGSMVYYTLWPTLSKFIPHDILPILQANVMFILFWSSVPIVVMIFTAGIVMTHRIAGPLYNIEQKLEQVLQGEAFPIIRLRKGDELQELAQKLNAVFQKTEESHRSLKK